MHGTENLKIDQSFIEHWELTDYVQLRSPCNNSWQWAVPTGGCLSVRNFRLQILIQYSRGTESRAFTVGLIIS